MTRKGTLLLFTALLFVSSVVVGAQQTTNPNSIQTDKDNALYKITINVAERSTTAVNYRNRAGSTTIDFKGTPLLPRAKGEARIETKKGYTEIEVEFENLEPATRYGSEYLTYVLWAISPEGRALNLGEVLLDGTRSKLDVTSQLQAFGLIVTAEPYFAVTQPSDVVVMENFISAETRGQVEQIHARYELLQRGQYTTNVVPSELKPIPLDKKVPLELYEARNAVRIARWSGADTYAKDSFGKAEDLLQQAENHRARKEWKPLTMMSREAVQTAEDARLITLKRQEENRAAQERSASAVREADERAKAQHARDDAERSDLLRVQEALKREAAESARAASQANAAREIAEAQASTQRAAVDKQAAEAETDRARQAVATAEREKRELREALVTQFNAILETRDSARGLIVNMSDVVFDTGKATLKPGAREKLAKISGIVLAHPGLKLEVEGHTDSVGTDEYNQTLSDTRASAVRDFLIAEGVRSSMITARGFGESRPVASNDTAAGRQLNRRVELVVSGDIIGNPLGRTSSLVDH